MKMWRAAAAMSVLLWTAAGFGLAVHYEAPAPKTEAQTTILFGGDAMFDRAIRLSIEKHGGDFIFSCIDSVLSSADLGIVNLEGPITEASSTSVGSQVGSPENYHFTFAPETAKLLHDHHVGAVMIGNNHIQNEGREGIYFTKASLAAEGLGYFGSPLDGAPLHMESNSIPLSFIAYNEFAPGIGGATRTLQQIRRAQAQGRVPIVYAHWGLEYEVSPTTEMQTLAHAFAEAGAKLIVGSHSHVVGEKEEYQNVPIYYSLGNFIFDQYFSPAVRRGLLLKVVISREGVMSIKEIPTQLELDGRTCPLDS